MKQILLKIEIPNGKELRGADFREALAKNADLPETFFNYENGAPKNSKGGFDGSQLEIDALPSVCVVSGKSWVGILAQPGSDDYIDMATGKAIRIAGQLAGTACKAEVQALKFGCAERKEPVTYWIREMVIKRRNPGARAADIQTLVEQRVKAGLLRYAAAYGHILPTWDDMDLRITLCDRPRGLAIRTTKGTTNEYATLVDVEFKAFLDLQGIWMVGNLTSRGYGRICAAREMSASRLEVIK